MDAETSKQDDGPTSANFEQHEHHEPSSSRLRQAAVPITETQVVIIVLGIVVLLIAKARDYQFTDFSLHATHYIPTDADRSQGWRSQPVGTVKWWPCTGDNDLPESECGYIIVPKDYFDVEAGTTKIALGRFKATSQPSKGTLLFHPGTPGAHGKTFVTAHAHGIRTLVGKDYDVVGFDARGTGQTEPKLQCFGNVAPGQEYTNKPYYNHGTFMYNTVLDRGYEFPLNATKEELRQILLPQLRTADALRRTEHQVCEINVGDDLKYVGTTSVVRDMEAIVTKLDGVSASINFIGGSYGSIVGQYLVNLFPERVGRVVLHDILSADSWSHDPSYRHYKQWLSSMDDFYKFFFSKCSQAGPEVCKLARIPNEDPASIRLRFEDSMNELYYSPMPVPRTLSPSILTAGLAWKRLYEALRRPDSWTSVFYTFSQLVDGDARGILDHVSFSEWYFDMEQSAIICNDGPRFAPPTTAEMMDEYLDVFQNVSPISFAAISNELDAGCQYWPVSPPERFVGPWNHTLKSPILIVDDMPGPRIPTSNSRLLAGSLGESSVLLAHDNADRTSAASLCVGNHVKAYFSNGTLPPKGTVCRPDNVELDADDDDYFFSRSLYSLSNLLHASRRGHLGITR